MNKKTNLPSLQETRIQGSITFPCTMYTADAFSRMETGEKPAPFHTRLHWHEAMEILFFRSGNYRLTVNTQLYEIREETICFVESGSLHAISCEENYLEHALLFDPSFLGSSHADEAGKTLIEPLMQKKLRFPVILPQNHPAFPEIRDEFLRLLKIFRSKGAAQEDQTVLRQPASQLRVKACILTILAVLAENDLLALSDPVTDPRIIAFKKVMLYMQDHYDEKITLTQLARIMNMNEQYFCRFFKKSTGKTVVTYLNEIRIRQAALMMTRDPDHYTSVSDVASSCGFGNMGHFIEEFRRFTGCSPTEYRKTHKERIGTFQ